MREDDGRKLDHQTLEAIRLRAVEQVARGVPAARVGAGLAALGLHRRTIYTWLAKERTEGRQALRAKPVPGRARKLSDAQLGELAGLIAETDPRDHGFAVALWTRDVVRAADRGPIRRGADRGQRRAHPARPGLLRPAPALPRGAGRSRRGGPVETDRVPEDRRGGQGRRRHGVLRRRGRRALGLPRRYHLG